MQSVWKTDMSPKDMFRIAKPGDGNTAAIAYAPIKLQQMMVDELRHADKHGSEKGRWSVDPYGIRHFTHDGTPPPAPD